MGATLGRAVSRWVGPAAGRAIGRAACALALAAGLAACASPRTVQVPPPPPQPTLTPAPLPAPPPTAGTVPQDGKTRVALLVPLSGRGQQIGQSMLDAAQLAVFELADDQFLLMPRDTKGTPQGAEQAARTALAEGAQIILGPLFSPDAAAVKPVAAQAGVPVVSFSNDAAVAGGGLWVLGFQPQDQVRRVVSFAGAQGITQFAALVPSTPYGQAVLASMTDAAQQSGGRVVKVERFAQGGDHSATVRRLTEFDRRKADLEAERSRLRTAGDEGALRRLQNADTYGELPFQAVMIAEGGSQLRELASLFPFYDADPGPVRFLGTGLWDEAGLGREPALVGGWFAAPAPEARQGYEQRFQEVYGYRPHRLSTLAYDATAVAAVLAKAGGFRPFTDAALTNPNGYSGLDGIFRLLPGGLAERGLAVLEVTRGGTTVIDPAPSTFQALGS